MRPSLEARPDREQQGELGPRQLAAPRTAAGGPALARGSDAPASGPPGDADGLARTRETGPRQGDLTAVVGEGATRGRLGARAADWITGIIRDVAGGGMPA